MSSDKTLCLSFIESSSCDKRCCCCCRGCCDCDETADAMVETVGAQAAGKATCSTARNSAVDDACAVDKILSKQGEEKMPRTATNLLRSTLLNIYNEISALPTLSPNPATEAAFSKLIHTCCQPANKWSLTETEISQFIATDKVIQAFHPTMLALRGKAETCLENYHARLIIASENPVKALEEFPYYRNYVNMIHTEAHILYAAIGAPLQLNPYKVMFIGSGPLPMSALLLARDYFTFAQFTCIDMDENANALARQIVSFYCDSKRFQFISQDINHVEQNVIEGCNVIFMAALVGPNCSTKLQILSRIASKMQKGAFLMIRSTCGLKTLLYPELKDVDWVQFGLNLIFNVHPGNQAVHSVVVLQKD
ncbi:hypothetical protein HK100_003719 [Physocladia obscura]|uniref:Nicotianamine synthase n=1 Tax=Physocladia obscura TaxID=109957 RepID=A0AAD5XJ89_9FUNG|nr:hypothetical protein HK100_003719 [Physocladia obscura]